MAEPANASANLLQNGVSLAQFKADSGRENLQNLAKQINGFLTELITKQSAGQTGNGNNGDTMEADDDLGEDSDEDDNEDPEIKKMKMS